MPRFAPHTLLVFSLLMLMSMSATRIMHSFASATLAPAVVAETRASPKRSSAARPGVAAGLAVVFDAEQIFGHGVRVVAGAVRPVADHGWRSLARTSRAVTDARWQRETATSLYFAARTGAGSTADGRTQPPSGARRQRKTLGWTATVHAAGHAKPISTAAARVASASVAAPAAARRPQQVAAPAAYLEFVASGRTASAQDRPNDLSRRYGLKL